MTQAVRVTLTVVAILLSPFTSVALQSKTQSSAGASGRREIRKFDFLNRTYYADCVGMQVRVRNGSYHADNPGFEFVVSVSYGDLTGEGVEEAVVVTQCDGAVQSFTRCRVYVLRDHRLLPPLEIQHGSNNDGYIEQAKIYNGQLVVKRGPGPQRCDGTQTTTYELEDNRLKRVGRSICD